MKIPHYEKSYHYNLIYVMQFEHWNENSLLWWKLISLMKILHCLMSLLVTFINVKKIGLIFGDENISMGWKLINLMKTHSCIESILVSWIFIIFMKFFNGWDQCFDSSSLSLLYILKKKSFDSSLSVCWNVITFVRIYHLGENS